MKQLKSPLTTSGSVHARVVKAAKNSRDSDESVGLPLVKVALEALENDKEIIEANENFLKLFAAEAQSQLKTAKENNKTIQDVFTINNNINSKLTKSKNFFVKSITDVEKKKQGEANYKDVKTDIKKVFDEIIGKLQAEEKQKAAEEKQKAAAEKKAAAEEKATIKQAEKNRLAAIKTAKLEAVAKAAHELAEVNSEEEFAELPKKEQRKYKKAAEAQVAKSEAAAANKKGGRKHKKTRRKRKNKKKRRTRNQRVKNMKKLKRRTRQKKIKSNKRKRRTRRRR